MALGSLTGIKISQNRNLSKQPVSFEEAKTIFNDSLYVEFSDPDHLEGVDIMLERLMIFGQPCKILGKG